MTKLEKDISITDKNLIEKKNVVSIKTKVSKASFCKKRL